MVFYYQIMLNNFSDLISVQRLKPKLITLGAKNNFSCTDFSLFKFNVPKANMKDFQRSKAT